MTVELIDYSHSKGSPLPHFTVEFNPPERWQGMIAEVQSSYLKQTSFGKARNFAETIKQLETLIIADRIIDQKHVMKVRLLAYSALNLEIIFLVFSNPLVTEMFSNKIDNDIIISHRKYGRCRTNLKFNSDMWRALKIRAEYDSGQPLNTGNPALKFGIQSELGNFRISLQVEPLSSLGPTFTIRRLPKSAITLTQLINEKQIDRDDADYLLKAILQRKNIIVAGEPGSGKTTLANALLLHAEKSWRLIIMEDAREISIDPKDFPLLIQYNMPSVGEKDRYRTRSNEISRLLHRSPDYVFLGEIQNQDDTRVAFEGFAAGIRGIATTHAKSITGLLTRWTKSHQLAEDLVSSLDVIVMTSRSMKEGKVKLGVHGVYQQKEGEIHEINR